MGKPFFIKEQEIEALLAFETRELIMPDGSKRPYTGMKLHWNSYEYITREVGLFTGPELVAMAVRDSQEMKRSFEDSFRNTIAYVHQQIKKKRIAGGYKRRRCRHGR